LVISMVEEDIMFQKFGVKKYETFTS